MSLFPSINPENVWISFSNGLPTAYTFLFFYLFLNPSLTLSHCSSSILHIILLAITTKWLTCEAMTTATLQSEWVRWWWYDDERESVRKWLVYVWNHTESSNRRASPCETKIPWRTRSRPGLARGCVKTWSSKFHWHTVTVTMPSSNSCMKSGTSMSKKLNPKGTSDEKGV